VLSGQTRNRAITFGMLAVTATQAGTLSEGMPSVNIDLPAAISGEVSGSPATGLWEE